jgi:heptosyltransferase-1
MKVLIVKTSSLGDIIHAFPLLTYIRCQHPQAQIDWVVEAPFAELVQAHPLVNQTLCVQTRKWRKQITTKKTWQELRQFKELLRAKTYDVLLDLQGNAKSGFITACANSILKVGFGYKSVSEWPNLLFTNQRYNPPKGQNIRNDYLFLAQKVFGNFNYQEEGVQLSINAEESLKIDGLLAHDYLQKGKKILVCSGSNWNNKQLSPYALQAFLKRLSQTLESSFVFAWGSLEEKKIAEELAQSFPKQAIVLEKLGLSSLQNLMSRLDLVIAMDSLPLHLAGTTTTPTYSVFGASLAQKYKPIGMRHEAFQGACPYGKSFEKRCSILRTCPTGSCIKDIQTETLHKHFLDWWQQTNN